MVHFGLKRSIWVHLGPPTVLWPFLISCWDGKERVKLQLPVTVIAPDLRGMDRRVLNESFNRSMDQIHGCFEYSAAEWTSRLHATIVNVAIHQSPVVWPDEKAKLVKYVRRCTKSGSFGYIQLYQSMQSAKLKVLGGLLSSAETGALYLRKLRCLADSCLADDRCCLPTEMDTERYRRTRQAAARAIYHMHKEGCVVHSHDGVIQCLWSCSDKDVAWLPHWKLVGGLYFPEGDLRSVGGNELTYNEKRAARVLGCRELAHGMYPDLVQLCDHLIQFLEPRQTYGGASRVCCKAGGVPLPELQA